MSQGRCAACSSSGPLRGPGVALWIHCCINVTPSARALASRFALRLCAAARRLARAVALALLARRFAASGSPIVQRCCAALLARSAGRGSSVRRCCGALPRFAHRRPVSPLLRLAAGLRDPIHIRTRSSTRIPIRFRKSNDLTPPTPLKYKKGTRGQGFRPRSRHRGEVKSF